MAKTEIKYEIVEHIAVLSESENGWSKQLNKISWNGGTPKYDIRDWNKDRTKMSKGITLTDAEAEELRIALTNNIF